MKKNHLSLLLAVLFITARGYAQNIIPCYTDEMNKKYEQKYPDILIYKKQLDNEINTYLTSHASNHHAYKTTISHNDSDWYDIPVVIHIVHNGGPELIPDTKVYQLIQEMNNFYSLNFNNSAVVPEFKAYIGKPKFRFHLAQKDPNGNPTNGITHRLSYLTYGRDDQAKVDQWSPANYVNIWFEYVIGATITNGIIVAYTELPPDAAVVPYYDGIISNYSFINDGAGGTGGGSIDHEMGHYFYLYHTFGHTNNPHTNTSGNCTDDDGVDDTPPTEGNLGGCHLYDTVCATNYFKIYNNISGGDSLVNYPDTSNEQNIMNYADCKNMFTKGQVWRMRGTLNSSVANRNNIWNPNNLVNLGIWADTTGTVLAVQDKKPIPEFIAVPATGSTTTSNTNYMSRVSYYVGPNTNVTFKSTTWNDTVSSLLWTFSNNAANPTMTSTPTSLVPFPTVTNSFSDPGWVTLTLQATGNNTGDTSVTWNRAIYVADATALPAASYWEQFTAADTAKCPAFNYYNNEFKWQFSNIGMADNSSMMYTGYDERITNFSLPTTGTPAGDFDDLFLPPVDLSGYTAGNCSFNYDYSGASRSSTSVNINDTLEIDYSINKGGSWNKLAAMTKSTLENKGGLSVPYYPLYSGDWAHMSVDIPSAAITNYTMFRLRYKPGVYNDANYYLYGYSSGNNFFVDNVSFSTFPASVNNINLANGQMAVIPNPTQGDATIVIAGAGNADAHVMVSDITGKAVYSATDGISGSEAHIAIPKSAIATPGMYIVQVTTGAKTYTQKLVVY